MLVIFTTVKILKTIYLKHNVVIFYNQWSSSDGYKNPSLIYTDFINAWFKLDLGFFRHLNEFPHETMEKKAT